ncbi:MAG: hypothetical protein Q9167_005864 [Letrouitia subvulpina]
MCASSIYVLADPSVLQVNNTYYAYGTQHKQAKINVPYAVSKHELQGRWKAAKEDAMPRNGTGLGDWTLRPHGDSGLWNPDVSKLNSTHFIIYYSAKSKNAHAHERCIGVGYATRPTGPFVPTSSPWYCPPSAGAIGVDAIIDNSTSPATRYVLFKNGSFDGTAGHISHVVLWQVSVDDGFTKIGDPVALTTSLPNEIGEESPALAQMPDNRWLLLHTEGIWNRNYTVVYAVSNGTDIRGPYQDYHYDGVLLDSRNSTIGGKKIWRPGGPDFVDGSNRDFIFAAMSKNQSGARYIYSATMGYRPANAC